MSKPKQYTSGYKFERVMESLRKDNLVEIGRRYGISPKLLSKWRIQFIQNGYKIFETVADKENTQLRNQVAKLEQLVGKKEIELSFVQNFLKDSGISNGS